MNARTSSMVHARDLVVSAGRSTLLQGAGIEVAAGQVVAIVGPNGAGKSTLLSALTGGITPRSGTASVCDLTPWDAPVTEFARHVGVLPQTHMVSFDFRVEEVVAMGRFPWRGTAHADRDDELVAAAMADAEVAHLADRTVATLSGGERARVALARVLSQQTQALFLDEPTAALDIRHTQQVLSVGRRRAREGAAVVVVLHDLTAAARCADEVVLLADGRCVASGPPGEVMTEPTLSEVYRWPVRVTTEPGSGQLVVQPENGDWNQN